MTDLAARCEAAAGPDRELDCLIFESRHLLLTSSHRGYIDGEPTGEYYGVDGNQLPERAPFYTASIDAAMTLMPPLEDTLRPLSILMGVSENGLRFQTVLKNWHWGAVRSSDRCASYALALCAAALRAASSVVSSTEPR